METKAMAVLLFVSLASSTVLVSGISVAATDPDKKGYEVTTVLDGNKLGIAFYSVYEDTNGGLSVVVLDSSRSSIHRVSLPFSQSSVVEIITGGTSGYRDGSTREAQFFRPKKLTVDSDGTIYVADTRNGAVRMVTRAGFVTTIAGGSNRTGHIDGEGREVTFSNDFDVTYLRSSCTLAVADRGNRVIREIRLPQFIGRCGGGIPNFPGSTLTIGLLQIAAGTIIGTVALTILTLLTISPQQLEKLQSGLFGACNRRQSQLIDLEGDRGALVIPAGNNETDFLNGLHNQACNNHIFSTSTPPPASPKTKSPLYQREVKDFEPFNSPEADNFLIPEDLIDLVEPFSARAGSVHGDNSSRATASTTSESTPAAAVKRVPTIDSMLESCLAKLAASPPNQVMI